MNPGDRVRLKGTDRIYLVMRLETHYQDVPEWKNKWAVLTPPTSPFAYCALSTMPL